MLYIYIYIYIAAAPRPALGVRPGELLQQLPTRQYRCIDIHTYD